MTKGPPHNKQTHRHNTERSSQWFIVGLKWGFHELFKCSPSWVFRCSSHRHDTDHFPRSGEKHGITHDCGVCMKRNREVKNLRGIVLYDLVCEHWIYRKYMSVAYHIVYVFFVFFNWNKGGLNDLTCHSNLWEFARWSRNKQICWTSLQKV